MDMFKDLNLLFMSAVQSAFPQVTKYILKRFSARYPSSLPTWFPIKPNLLAKVQCAKLKVVVKTKNHLHNKFTCLVVCNNFKGWRRPTACKIHCCYQHTFVHVHVHVHVADYCCILLANHISVLDTLINPNPLGCVQNRNQIEGFGTVGVKIVYMYMVLPK